MSATDGPARLWAPWRSRYLSTVHRRTGCFLCAAKRSRQDRIHQVVARGRRVFALLNRYPYANGHLLIAPYRHVGRVEALRPDEWQECFHLLQRLTARLRTRLRAQGFNLGMNVGRSGGAGVPGHLHLHLVPRWVGDTNFMPIISHTKIISQSLEALYQVLTHG